MKLLPTFIFIIIYVAKTQGYDYDDKNVKRCKYFDETVTELGCWRTCQYGGPGKPKHLPGYCDDDNKCKCGVKPPPKYPDETKRCKYNDENVTEVGCWRSCQFGGYDSKPRHLRGYCINDKCVCAPDRPKITV